MMRSAAHFIAGLGAGALVSLAWFFVVKPLAAAVVSRLHARAEQWERECGCDGDDVDRRCAATGRCER